MSFRDATKPNELARKVIFLGSFQKISYCLQVFQILILDEATSSIDNRSADLIHTVVRDRFKQATVISIAHRLESIEGYDRYHIFEIKIIVFFENSNFRVLVMHDGEVAEIDTPENLMNNPESKYAQMMKK